MTIPPSPPSPLSTPTRLTARTPEDLLVAAAVVLGFWPSSSAVMLTFDAAHPFHARVGLPATPDPVALAELTETLVRPAVHHRVGRVVLMIHTDDLRLGWATWRALAAALGAAGIGVVEALLVTDHRWYPLRADGDPQAATHPATHGVPYDLDDLAAHPFLAQAVLEGRVLHRSREELAATLDPDPDGIAEVAAVAAALPTHDAAALDDVPTQLAEGTWAEALVAGHLAASTRADDADVARLLCGMQSLRVRDAAWSAITRELARPAASFFADLTRRAPDHLLPPAATLAGWAAWQAGDGALAWCAIDRCLDVDPDYGLGRLLAEALDRAVPPTVWTEGFDWREGLEHRPTG